MTYFSQFAVGGTPESGDIIVGLRDGVNTQFNFPGLPQNPWVVVNVSQEMDVNTGYLVTAAGPITLTLPSVSSIGDIVQIVNLTNQILTIGQGAGQAIAIGNQASTVGVGGSIANTQIGDSIYLVCFFPGDNWVSLGAPQGIWVVT